MELELRKKSRELEDSKKEIELEVQRKVEKEKTKIESDLRLQISEELQKGVKEKEHKISELEKALDKTKEETSAKFEVELEDLKNQVLEKDKKIAEVNKMELELRKKTRELEDSKKELELDVQRKLDEERKNIEDNVYGKFEEEHRLKDLEKEKTINDLKKSLDDAKRKAEQGSMQTQGEVLELYLEFALKNHFQSDIIEPVPKGIKGADIIQKVFNSARKECGKILWETKSTKNWNNNWIDKLKDDQREIGAEIAIIVSKELPEDIDNFGIVNGIWITGCSYSLGLATALREQLIQVSFVKRSNIGKNEKMEAIYQYLSGPEFKQKVEAIVETFSTMQKQLDKEKRAMTKIWKEREKQIDRIMTNTIGMYGDVKGIIGATLPEISALELDTVEEPKKLASNSG